MPLTRSFSALMQHHAAVDPVFGAALLREGIDTMLSGDVDTGRAILRDYIKGRIGFEKLGEATGTQPKSLIRMFGPRGNPQATNLFNVLSYLQKQAGLQLHVTAGLPGSDVDGPVRLKELVTRKALPESAGNPTITKTDVLRALQTDTDRLFPAPPLIKASTGIVPRDQETDLARQIIQTTGRAIIVHADAGVGKSVFATRIGQALPEGSVCILYDCFGNGLYRNASGYRHRHKDALVQIANELAGQGLCYPLIPSVNADATDYMRAFLARVKASIAALRAVSFDALLCIAIDAADNARMAANEIGETRSFARDLLREEMPEGVRLVVLCRTHRRQLLDPSPQALCLEIKPFSRAETAVYLRQAFPDASDHDVDEFHRLSSQNPRVQATALRGKHRFPKFCALWGRTRRVSLIRLHTCWRKP